MIEDIPEPAIVGGDPTPAIRERIRQIREADERDPGSTLRGGDTIGVWQKGEHPYGEPAACPFCEARQEYTSFWYNGYGPPPQYAYCCDECGAQGPCGSGFERGDHLGARREAVRLWSRVKEAEA